MGPGSSTGGRAGIITRTLVSRGHTWSARAFQVQEQASVLIQELEANPNFPEGHVITKESWDNADKIIHDGFVYVKYSDLLFYK